MVDQPETIIIIGAGLGGVAAAGALRQAGYSGRIILINGETELPYDRPPLSKSVLQGADALADIYLKPDTWYEENNLELLSGAQVVSIEPGTRRLVMEDGSALAYDKLLLATGADVRRIPELEQDRIPYHYLRSYQDALALKAGLGSGKRLVLIGAGVIGLEVAASARQCGSEVSVIEVADRVMARSVPEHISAWLQEQHENRGVKFFMEDSVAGIQDQNAGPRIQLSSGMSLPADLMLICVGVAPATRLARECGIECDNGVIVDEYCRTSAEDIFAIGDVACYPDAWEGRIMRSENWMHAQKQAECAALNMNGEKKPYTGIQSLWTDQYNFKLQLAGVISGDQEVIRGDMDSGNFMIFYLRKGVVVGVLGVNQPKLMRMTQNVIKSGSQVDVAILADSKANIKKAVLVNA